MSIMLTWMSRELPSRFLAAIGTLMEDAIERSDKGWRGSEDLWIDAAYLLLVETGVESVKIMTMAKALGMSRTSFYWHFPDRETLLDALILRWRRKNTANLIERTELYAATIAEAVFNLFDCWIRPELFDARLDFAIRNWAQSAPDLKRLVERTDSERVDTIRAMFARHGYGPEQADIRARTVYLTQVGYISMMADEPLDVRLSRMPAYVEAFTGNVPAQPEIDRFMSRHVLGGND
jgi:AcrR family transcriptional regulator